MPSEVGPEVHAQTLTGLVNCCNPQFSDDNPLWCMEIHQEPGADSPPMNRIRELRLQRGQRLDEAARLVGTSVQQLSRLERGERRLTDAWMRRIAVAFGVHPATLLADFGPNTDEFVKLTQEEQALLDFWHTLVESERAMILAYARTKGFFLRDAANDLLSTDDGESGKRRA